MLRWCVKRFAELSADELFGIFKLRQDVFILEQDCIYPDIDELDKASLHIYALEDDGSVVACTRLVSPGLKYEEPSIGRVVVAASHRKEGLGRVLMQHSITQSEQVFPKLNNRIGAQLYLRDFYASLGYQQVSEEYDEDGIPHIDMLRLSD